MACGDGDEWCPKCRVYGWHQPGNDCPEFERQERERGWLARQIEDARKMPEHPDLDKALQVGVWNECRKAFLGDVK